MEQRCGEIENSISYINPVSTLNRLSSLNASASVISRNPSSISIPPCQNLYSSNPVSDPIQLSKPTSNGGSISKKTSSPQLPAPPPPLQLQEDEGKYTVRYRECLKNHAASMGTRVVDGCGEFMPNGEEGTPEALKCAACDCHRNFHRQESDAVYPLPSTTTTNIHSASIMSDQRLIVPHRNITYDKNYYRGKNVLPPPPRHSLFTMPPPPHHHHRNHYYGKPNTPTAPTFINFGIGTPSESSSEDLNIFKQGLGQKTSSLNKKRSRTKFTQQQKEKMHEFAEKLGWKLQKQNEQELQQFCHEIGIKRQVLKVWMHNNKQAMKKERN